MRGDLCCCTGCQHTVSKDTLEYNDRYWGEHPAGAFMGRDVRVGGDYPSFNQVCPECGAENSFEEYYGDEDQTICQGCGGVIDPDEYTAPEAVCLCDEPIYVDNDGIGAAVERALTNWESHNG